MGTIFDVHLCGNVSIPSSGEFLVIQAKSIYMCVLNPHVTDNPSLFFSVAKGPTDIDPDIGHNARCFHGHLEI